MDWSKRRQKFRSILAGTSCVSPASVFDPLSSRIAEEVGFNSKSSFNSVFKKHTNMTPSEFRNKDNGKPAERVEA